VLIEDNWPYNYSSAAAISSWNGNVVFGGMMIWNTSSAAGSSFGWTVSATGYVTTTNWAGTTAYSLNQYVNNGGNVYRCTVAGTSAGSGGPSGTGTGIVDGGVTWNYVSPQPILNSTGMIEPTPTTGIAAAGSTQAAATQLGKGVSVVATSTAGTAIGVKLPATPNANDTCYVFNASANAITVYPATSGFINSNAINTGVSVAAGATAIFKAYSSTQWVGNF